MNGRLVFIAQSTSAQSQSQEASRSLRVLYVTNGFPYPLSSGHLRHYHLIRRLAKNHSISLLALTGSQIEEPHAEEMRRYCSVSIFEAGSSSKPGSKALRRMTSIMFRAGGEKGAHRLGHAARAMIAGGEVDVIVFSGKRTAPALPHLQGVPIVIDVCDAASERLRGSLRYGSRRRRAARLMEYVTMRRVERKLVAEGDHLLFASPRDREPFDSRNGVPLGRATIMPNGIDSEYWCRSTPRLGRRVVFTGAMHYAPNEDAALHLALEVMPLVRRAEPEAELWIVGRDPTERLRVLHGKDGVHVTGTVSDIRPFLEEAAVFAAPLRFGAGIQNKVLEAMAMSVPVVASSVAADGVRATADPLPCAVADDPSDFAGLIVDRLRHAAGGGTPDESGRLYVTRNFDWDASARKLEEILIDVVQTYRGRSER